MKKLRHLFPAAVCALAAAVAFAAVKNGATETGAAADVAGVRSPDDGSKTGTDYSVPAILERFVMGGAFSPDFEEGLFSWKGRQFNMGTSRAARARFERYLAAPPEEFESERTYRETLAQIGELLKIVNQTKDKDRVFLAWKLLFDAAQFPADADGSLLVANQVYNAWSVRGEYTEAMREKVELERTRRAQERTNAYWTWTNARQGENAPRPASQQTERPRRGAASGNANNATASTSSASKTNVSVKVGDAEFSAGDQQRESSRQPVANSISTAAVGMTTAAFAALDLARTNAEIAALEVGSAAANMRAKLEFQTQIVSFLLQRRFDHALLAIDFYQHIFKGSHQGLEVGKDRLAQLLLSADVTPSMRTLESVAREAQADVRTGMRAVEASYDSGDRWAALERLQETFLLGEHSAEVNAFPSEKRRVLLEIYRAARDLQKVAELKDYASAESILETLRAVAPDFPSAPALSAVRGAQQASNIALYAARQSLLAGDAEAAQKSVAQAAELWPLNPAIETFARDVADKVDISAQAAPLFDRLLASKNYREIAAQGAEFGLAFARDSERAAALKDIVTRISKIDMAIEFANEARAQGSPYAAWETLLGARAIEPDDPDLARAMSATAAQAGDFARLLDNAERLLAENRPAAALANYLAAQDLYPVSQRCRIGAEKAAQALMRARAAAEPQP